ncbi:MAG: ABC transporter substrate-binding protein [Bacteroidales bacterium]|jgi:iron complex transport system substrate-binding protein
MSSFQKYAILVLLVLNSCSYPAKNKQANDPVIVTDFRGKEVRLDEPAKKVVCLIESALSGIYMLKQKEKLTGIPSSVYDKGLFKYYSRLDPRIQNRELPVPGNWDFISIEQVIGLNPDLVILWASQTGAIDNIEQFGIPVYAVMLQSFNDVYKEIEDFGKLLNCGERADSLIQQTRNNLDSLRIKFNRKNPKKVYFMWAQGITETSGSNSTVNELLTIAGTVNACNLQPEHVSVSIEKIYDWDPDLIVMWHNERLDPDDVLKHPVLQGLKAVKQKHVYELPEVFACDFWTLKMQYPAGLIGNWAYSPGTTDPYPAGVILKKMYVELYGKPLH